MSQEPLFTASCPTCDEVWLDVDQLWLVVSRVSELSHYAFRCPGCAALVRRRADSSTVDLLTELVAVEELDVPAEALESHDGPPLTVDDLIDLMVGLHGRR